MLKQGDKVCRGAEGASIDLYLLGDVGVAPGIRQCGKVDLRVVQRDDMEVASNDW